jgi:glycosyltransferase involved in cell wall biosynthesis
MDCGRGELVGSVNPPTVSVALATFNGERFLREQLASLISQTRPPDELVVCDDGSTDATIALLDAFAATAPFRVRIFRNKDRLGYRDNFLQAAKLCDGQLIAYCDQDDVWLPPKLERCVDAFTVPEPPSAIVHSYAVVDQTLVSLGFDGPKFARPGRVAPADCPLFAAHNGSALCFDRRLLALAPTLDRPEDVHAQAPMSHDKWILFLAAAANGIHVLPERLMLYRQHGGNLAGAGTGDIASRVHRIETADYGHYLRLSRLADERAVVIEQIGRTPDMGPAERGPATDRGRSYRTASQALRRRAGLYAPGRTMRWRSGHLARLAADRCYSATRHGGLGIRALTKDLVVTVIGPGSLRPVSQATVYVRRRLGSIVNLSPAHRGER